MTDQDTVTEPEVPLDDEAKRLKLEAIKAEARKSIAQAQQATLAAQLPKSDVTPPEGKIEVGDKVGLVAQVVAYGALRDVASQIADSAVKDLSNGTGVLIVDNRELVATDWPYSIIHDELTSHLSALKGAVKALEKYIPTSTGPDVGQPQNAIEGPSEEGQPELGLVPSDMLTEGITAVQGVTGGIADIAAMFRNDYAISSRETAIGTIPLIAAIATVLASKKTLVVDGFELLSSDSGLLKDFNDARTQRRDLEAAKIRTEQQIVAVAANADALRTRIKEAGTEYDKKLAESKRGTELTKFEGELKDMQARLDELDRSLVQPHADIAVAVAAMERFDAFVTAVTTVPTGVSHPPLVTAAIRQRLHAGASGNVTHVLFVEVDTAGAENLTMRGLFRQRVRFIGGLHASYLLLAVKDNKIVGAGTAACIRQVNYKLRTGDFDVSGIADLYISDSGKNGETNELSADVPEGTPCQES